jgi:hypothetical protein
MCDDTVKTCYTPSYVSWLSEKLYRKWARQAGSVAQVWGSVCILVPPKKWAGLSNTEMTSYYDIQEEHIFELSNNTFLLV